LSRINPSSVNFAREREIGWGVERVKRRVSSGRATWKLSRGEPLLLIVSIKSIWADFLVSRAIMRVLRFPTFSFTLVIFRRREFARYIYTNSRSDICRVQSSLFAATYSPWKFVKAGKSKNGNVAGTYSETFFHEKLCKGRSNVIEFGDVSRIYIYFFS